MKVIKLDLSLRATTHLLMHLEEVSTKLLSEKKMLKKTNVQLTVMTSDSTIVSASVSKA